MSKWDKMNKSYINYQNYIVQKKAKFELSLIDLLHVSNFKGGNGTIHEEESVLADKLKSYSHILQGIDSIFGVESLGSLKDNEIKKLITLVESACALTIEKTPTKIDGLSVSYLSALMNAHFPNLIPIIDRRVLLNLELVSRPSSDYNETTNQVINIGRFYGSLIHQFATLSKEKQLTIRELDRLYFIG